MAGPDLDPNSQMTRETWWKLPDRDRLELVKGRVIPLREDETADEIAGNLLRFLSVFAEDGDRFWVLDASCGYAMDSDDPATIRRPRVSLVRRDHVPIEKLPPKHGELDLAPEVAVEVVGPDEAAETLESRVQEYLDAGVLLVWVVHPATRSVRVHRQDGSETLLHEVDDLHGEEVVPGFVARVSTLFPEEKPTLGEPEDAI